MIVDALAGFVLCGSFGVRIEALDEYVAGAAPLSEFEEADYGVVAFLVIVGVLILATDVVWPTSTPAIILNRRLTKGQLDPQGATTPTPPGPAPRW